MLAAERDPAVVAATLSADGTRVVAVTADAITIRDLGSGATIVRPGHGLCGCARHPRDALFAVTEGSDVVVRKLADGSIVATVAGAGGATTNVASNPVFLGDGSRILAQGKRPSIVRWADARAAGVFEPASGAGHRRRRSGAVARRKEIHLLGRDRDGRRRDLGRLGPLSGRVARIALLDRFGGRSLRTRTSRSSRRATAPRACTRSRTRWARPATRRPAELRRPSTGTGGSWSRNAAPRRQIDAGSWRSTASGARRRGSCVRTRRRSARCPWIESAATRCKSMADADSRCTTSCRAPKSPRARSRNPR